MFGDRKNGRAAIEYPHPLLEGILAETYGIFVYQEQVMQAAQVLAGYSLGERRPAAPRDGQEDQVGDGRPARDASSRAARRTTRSRRPRPTSCST